MKWQFEVGTLLNDSGKVCMVSAHLPSGCETFDGYAKINWRDNYELIYANSTVYVIGASALHRMVETGKINLIKDASDP